MKITTLWNKPYTEGDMPDLINAYDEYTEESNCGAPDDYMKDQQKYPEARELIIDIPESVVVKLFATPVVTAMAANPKV